MLAFSDWQIGLQDITKHADANPFVAQLSQRLLDFFSVRRLYGFRQVVHHVLVHVANWN